MTHVEGIGPVLVCAACGSVAADYSGVDFDKLWMAQSSPILKWQDELTCMKSEKSSRM